MNITYPLNSFSRDDIAAVNHACIGDCILHKKTGEYGSFQLVGTSLAPGACMLAGRYWETDSYTPIDLAAVEGNAYIKIRLDTTQLNYGFSVVCEADAAVSGNGIYEMDLYAVTVAGGVISLLEKLYRENQWQPWQSVGTSVTIFGGGAVNTDFSYAIAGNTVMIQGTAEITAVPSDEPFTQFIIDFEDSFPSEAKPQKDGKAMGMCIPPHGGDPGGRTVEYYKTTGSDFLVVKGVNAGWTVGDIVYISLFYPYA